MSGLRIPFNQLRPGTDAGYGTVGERAAIDAAIARVLDSGWFVLGPEVEAFEREFAVASGAAHAVAVANGTDAIALLLRAADVGPGDEVLVPAITAAFTALAVTAIGAVPVVVDVEDEHLTMDPAAAAAAVTSRTRAIVPVHLYGQAADVHALHALAVRHRLAFVEDCCQAHLCTSGGVPVGLRGIGGAFSFYPTKNLGALGDGGAIVTDDAEVAARLRRLRNGGQRDRYHHVETGMNSRLDEVQAAILRVRLPRLGDATRRRRALAARYRAQLPDAIRPVAERDPGHVYHLFPVRVAARDALQAHLRAEGIETLIHYPIPLHEQPAFAPFGAAPCPRASTAARELLSLPLHPRLRDDEVDVVTAATAGFLKGRVFA